MEKPHNLHLGDTIWLTICATKLGLLPICYPVQIVWMHQDSVSDNLPRDKKQKNLHPE